jgi:hypothetical protein
VQSVLAELEEERLEVPRARILEAEQAVARFKKDVAKLLDTKVKRARTSVGDARASLGMRWACLRQVSVDLVPSIATKSDLSKLDAKVSRSADEGSRSVGAHAAHMTVVDGELRRRLMLCRLKCNSPRSKRRRKCFTPHTRRNVLTRAHPLTLPPVCACVRVGLQTCACLRACVSMCACARVWPGTEDGSIGGM